MPATTRRSFSTTTLTPGAQIVPWLACDDPLAYSPETPPDRDYFFKYGYVMPGVLCAHPGGRRPHFFGAQRNEDAEELLGFWDKAREGTCDQVGCQMGFISDTGVSAPMAVYRVSRRSDGPAYLLMQQGSYQVVGAEDQRAIENGDVIALSGCSRMRDVPVAEYGKAAPGEHGDVAALPGRSGPCSLGLCAFVQFDPRSGGADRDLAHPRSKLADRRLRS